MIVGNKNLERFIVAYLSILFLLTSTLIYDPIKSLTGLDFSQTLMAAAIPAFVLAMFFKKETHTRSLTSNVKNSNSRFDVLITLLLFLSTLAVLILRAKQGWPSVTYDELFHLNYTNMIYRALGSGDYGSLVRLAQYDINPMFPYLLTVTLVRYSDFSLYSARIFVSMISSLVPVVTYFLVREYGVNRKVAALTALSLSVSSLFQSDAYLYVFDGLSTLLFTVAFFFLVKAVSKGRRVFFLLSSTFFYLLLVTKYPPAFLLLIIYIVAISFLITHKKCSARKYFPLVLAVSLFFMYLFFMIVFMPKVSFQLWDVFFGRSSLTFVYSRTLLWDLLLVLGWSPYLIVAVLAYRFLRSREKSEVTLFSLLAIILTFLTLVPFLPVTRRLIQVLPIFFATTVSYSTRKYSGVLVALVLLNLSWWGALGLITLL